MYWDTVWTITTQKVPPPVHVHVCYRKKLLHDEYLAQVKGYVLRSHMLIVLRAQGFIQFKNSDYSWWYWQGSIRRCFEVGGLTFGGQSPHYLGVPGHAPHRKILIFRLVLVHSEPVLTAFNWDRHSYRLRVRLTQCKWSGKDRQCIHVYDKGIAPKPYDESHQVLSDS